MEARVAAYVNKSYKYGFNGKEGDVESFSQCVAYEARVFDSRLGKFLSPDPLEHVYSWQSTYTYIRNCPITIIDFLGMGEPPSSTEGYNVEDEYRDPNDGSLYALLLNEDTGKPEWVFAGSGQSTLEIDVTPPMRSQNSGPWHPPLLLSNNTQNSVVPDLDDLWSEVETPIKQNEHKKNLGLIFEFKADASIDIVAGVKGYVHGIAGVDLDYGSFPLIGFRDNDFYLFGRNKSKGSDELEVTQSRSVTLIYGQSIQKTYRNGIRNTPYSVAWQESCGLWTRKLTNLTGFDYTVEEQSIGWSAGGGSGFGLTGGARVIYYRDTIFKPFDEAVSLYR